MTCKHCKGELKQLLTSWYCEFCDILPEEKVLNSYFKNDPVRGEDFFMHDLPDENVIDLSKCSTEELDAILDDLLGELDTDE